LLKLLQREIASNLLLESIDTRLNKRDSREKKPLGTNNGSLDKRSGDKIWSEAEADGTLAKLDHSKILSQVTKVTWEDTKEMPQRSLITRSILRDGLLNSTGSCQPGNLQASKNISLRNKLEGLSLEEMSPGKSIET
jgi:hypothetical protein